MSSYTSKELIRKVSNSLDILYSEESELLQRRQGKALCERCIVFRLGLILQKEFPDFFIDCDFNSECWEFIRNGEIISGENCSKNIKNPDGSFSKKFLDIIIHRRNASAKGNLVCMEIKKWNNYHKESKKKDINNLKFLTSPNEPFRYKLGFFISLGKDRKSTKITLFENGEEVIQQT